MIDYGRAELNNPPKKKPIVLLDSAAIQQRRVPLEELDMEDATLNKFKCSFCGKRFKHETSWDKHVATCRVRLRKLEVSSPVGIAAYSFYEAWNKKRGRGTASIEAFQDSKFYGQFIRFARELAPNISDPLKYIDIMIKIKALPAMWMNPAIMHEYFKWYDFTYHPYSQAEDSIQFLEKAASISDKTLTAYVETLSINELLQLLRQRKISPWVFVSSTALKNRIREMDAGQRKTLETVLVFNYLNAAIATPEGSEIVSNLKVVLAEHKL